MLSKLIHAQYIIIPLYMQILENLKKQIFKSINRLVLALQKSEEKIWGKKIIKLHSNIFGLAICFLSFQGKLNQGRISCYITIRFLDDSG